MIGDLYDARNVVVGQAAVYVAPQNTALPTFDTTGGRGWNAADPFDPNWISYYTVTNGGATSMTLTYTRQGKVATTGSLTLAGLTAAAVATALAGLANVGVGNVVVTGSTGGPFTVVFKNGATGGVLSATPTGGSVTVVNPTWTISGATDQGWQFGANKSTQTVGIEEQSTPVATTVTSQNVQILGSLSEDITRTLALALNATAQAVAATTTNPGYDLLSLTDTPLQYAVAMVTQNPQGYGRIIYAPAWTQLSNVQANFRRASDKRMYPVSFQTVCQTSQIAIYEFNSPHL